MITNYIRLLIAVSVVTLFFQSTVSAQYSNCDSVIFFADFEGPTGAWSVDNGLWQIGVDTIARYRSQSKVAGTLLNGRIPNDTYTTRLNRIFVLPNVTSNQELRLRYWSWFHRENSVQASVQIRVDTGGGNFNSWKTISATATTAWSPWSQSSVELTQYAGRRVNIGFAFSATWGLAYPAGGYGWYIDDVKIVKSVASAATPVAWDFEEDSAMCSGYNERWWADKFLWQPGRSIWVPPFSDTTCNGTILNGNIPNDTYSTKLISPPVQLPAQMGGLGVMLRFRYAFYRENNVNATVHIATDSGGGRWGAFEMTLAGPYTANTGWIRPALLIPTAYAGRRVQFGFSLNATWSLPYPAGGAGMYIDDVEVFHADSLPPIPVIYRRATDSVGTSLRPILRWHLSAGGDLYQVQVATDPSFSNIIRDTIKDVLSWRVQPALPSSGSYYYRVRAQNSNGYSPWSSFGGIIVNVASESDVLPFQYSLSQNYPNPFNPSTNISFSLPSKSHVSLKVFDLLGREVATLVNGVEDPGYKSVNFNANGLVSGVYFYRLQAGSHIETKKLILITDVTQTELF
ncbi:MAG: T9SS type A sorting domain-containing protein [Bacteroidota bacterium]|nr:T9SS type A sorting domain-containing protein [Bacteroidota bacterium]